MAWRGAGVGLIAAALGACIPAPPQGMPEGPPAEPTVLSAAADAGEPLGCERTAQGTCLPGCEELFGAGAAEPGPADAPPCEPR